MYQDIHWKTW